MSDQITELLYAAGKGDKVTIEAFIKAGGSPNTANHIGATLLMSASASYQIELIEYLLKCGAEVNSKTTEDRTALHKVVNAKPSLPERQKNCVSLLLSHGADVNAQDNTGLTPLMLGAWFNCKLAVEELVKAGAITDIRDNQGRTAKNMAELKKNQEIVEFFDGLQN